MKKWVLIFLLLFIGWALSFHSARSYPNKITKDTKQKTVGNIPPVNILKYDYSAEKNICLTDDLEFKKGLVSLTFDDGWKEIYQNAIPILDKAGVKSTQYVNIYESEDINSKYVTTENILAMERVGHEIGSHAIHHKRFTELSDSQVKEELEESKDLLLRMGLRSVDTFAYPYGEYTDYSVQLSRESRYIGVRISIPSMNDRRTDKFLIYGYQIENWMTFEPYIKRLIDRAIAEKKWLILIF